MTAGADYEQPTFAVRVANTGEMDNSDTTRALVTSRVGIPDGLYQDLAIAGSTLT